MPETVIIQQELFKPLIRFIAHFAYDPSLSIANLTILLPQGFVLDTNKVLSYFSNDVELRFCRNNPVQIKGTLKSESLSWWLFQELNLSTHVC